MDKGFTIIEVIVSMAVFLLVIGVATGIFVSIVKYQRSIIFGQELFNQISYAEERISKAVRMAKRDNSGECLIDNQGNSYPGQNYLLTRPVDGFYTGIKFLNASDEDSSGRAVCQEFYLDVNSHILMDKKANYEAIALTSSKLKINSIRFGFDGSNGCADSGCPIGDEQGGGGSGDYGALQPRITILLNVDDKIFQTTVSQRNLNKK